MARTLSWIPVKKQKKALTLSRQINMKGSWFVRNAKRKNLRLNVRSVNSTCVRTVINESTTKPNELSTRGWRSTLWSLLPEIKDLNLANLRLSYPPLAKLSTLRLKHPTFTTTYQPTKHWNDSHQRSLDRKIYRSTVHKCHIIIASFRAILIMGETDYLEVVAQPTTTLDKHQGRGHVTITIHLEIIRLLAVEALGPALISTKSKRTK